MIRAATTLADPVRALQDATSYWACVVANSPGHMSHHGAHGTEWTLVAPNELARLASLQRVPTRHLQRVQVWTPPAAVVCQSGRPRRPWFARVRALQATRGGVHEPGEHRRTGSRQVHLSTARSRPRGRGGLSQELSQEAAPRPAPRVPGHAPALHGGPGGLW